jgi:hypothetical protein
MTKHADVMQALRRARRVARSVVLAGREWRCAHADENEGRRLALAPQRSSTVPLRGIECLPCPGGMWMTAPTKLGTCCLICPADRRTRARPARFDRRGSGSQACRDGHRPRHRPGERPPCYRRAIDGRLGAELLQSIFECSTRLACRRASRLGACLVFCVGARVHDGGSR